MALAILVLSFVTLGAVWVFPAGNKVQAWATVGGAGAVCATLLSLGVPVWEQPILTVESVSVGLTCGAWVGSMFALIKNALMHRVGWKPPVGAGGGSALVVVVSLLLAGQNQLWLAAGILATTWAVWVFDTWGRARWRIVFAGVSSVVWAACLLQTGMVEGNPKLVVAGQIPQPPVVNTEWADMLERGEGTYNVQMSSGANRWNGTAVLNYPNGVKQCAVSASGGGTFWSEEVGQNGGNVNIVFDTINSLRSPTLPLLPDWFVPTDRNHPFTALPCTVLKQVTNMAGEVKKTSTTFEANYSQNKVSAASLAYAWGHDKVGWSAQQYDDILKQSQMSGAHSTVVTTTRDGKLQNLVWELGESEKVQVSWTYLGPVETAQLAPETARPRTKT